MLPPLGELTGVALDVLSKAHETDEDHETRDATLQVSDRAEPGSWDPSWAPRARHASGKQDTRCSGPGDCRGGGTATEVAAEFTLFGDSLALRNTKDPEAE